MFRGRVLKCRVRPPSAHSHSATHQVLRQTCPDLFRNALSESSKLETIERAQKLKAIKYSKFKKKAAILLSLCQVEGTPSLLYTVRSQDLRNHSGQVSFPGGQCDWTDRDVIHSALRETEEEIGIPQSCIDVWTVMPPFLDRFKTTVIHPVIGNIGNVTEDQLVPNQVEVSKIFTVPLHVLCDSRTHAFTTFRSTAAVSSSVYALPVFLTKPKVWGLTAIATELLLSLMFPDAICKKFEPS